MLVPYSHNPGLGPSQPGQLPIIDSAAELLVATDIYHRNSEYRVINLTSEFSSTYGYIYYASLYTGPSYVWVVLVSVLVITAFISNLLAVVTHVGAIIYTRRHMYKTVYSGVSSNNSSINSSSSSSSSIGYSSSAGADGLLPITAECDSHLVASSPTPVMKRTSCLGHRLACSGALVPAMSCCWKRMVQTCCTTCRRSGKYTIRQSDEVQQPGAHYPARTLPGVSIIKPLAGLDVNLEANLTSYFQLDYPQYEILFCVASEDDPVCELVRRLQKLYSNTESRLLVISEVVGVNPKVNNLQGGYNMSRYDLILISDSGVWMRPDTLLDMVETLTSNPRVGLVHQVPFMTPHNTTDDRYDKTLHEQEQQQLRNHHQHAQQHNQQSRLYDLQDSINPTVLVKILGYDPSFYALGTQGAPSFTWVVQQVFFGCWHARMYLFAALVGINCTSGMSCLLRKSVLQSCGGFKPFACYIAEDYFIAKYFRENGWLIKISHQPAWQNSPCNSLNQFLSRIIRWSHLRLSMALLAYILEPLTRCIPNALLGAFAFSYFLPGLIDPGVYFLCYTLVWFLLDYVLLCSIYPYWLPLCITKLEYLVAWCFWEITAVPFHYSSAFNRELLWRNRRFRVYWGGYSEQIFPSSETVSKDQPVDAGQNKPLLTV